MARGKQEHDWDLSNSVMTQVLNSSKIICDQLVACQGGKPKRSVPVNFMDLNAYRDK